MTHVLPELTYPIDSLAPAIDAETLSLHHGVHHRAYVRRLNEALAGYPDLQTPTVERLLRKLDAVPREIRPAVRQHGGGHANHSLLWSTLTPGGAAPGAAMQRVIAESFGSLDGLAQAFGSAAAEVFGSGWVFLTWRAPGLPLELVALPNQDSPLSQGTTPLLALDLWEHAYYLQFHADRPAWLDAWWRIIDWQAVATRLDEARSSDRRQAAGRTHAPTAMRPIH